MKIGIYAGSFNPIHIGHEILGTYLVDFAGMDEVWYLVSPQNPLKNPVDLLDESERFTMAELALDRYDNLKASDFEFHLSRPSYTIDTLRALRSKYPMAHFTLIIGADNWAVFTKWKDYQAILKEFAVLVFPRLGYAVEGIEKYRQEGCDIQIVNSPIIEISSSFIREVLAGNFNARAYLSPKVFSYITKQGLYLK